MLSVTLTGSWTHYSVVLTVNVNLCRYWIFKFADRHGMDVIAATRQTY